jgi:hypothetical protein
MGFIASANSVDLGQLAHLFYTVRFLVRNNLLNKQANNVNPDQMAQMSRLIVSTIDANR